MLHCKKFYGGYFLKSHCTKSSCLWICYSLCDR